MAKVKSAGLRNYVGRLGGSVYYMNKGQNIGRELAPEVSNPRTPAQMRQRMKWANLVNVYKANRSWMGHLSFETKPQTWSDYNAFMSANIGANPVYLPKTSAENGTVILAPYTMTKGALPVIGYEYAASVDGLITDIVLSSWRTTATIGELATDIIASNPEFQYGDQLSIVLMYRGSSPVPVVDAIEIILDTNDTRELSEVSGRFAALDEILTEDGDGHLAVILSAGVSYSQAAGCIVHSRTFSGRTSVSTQSYVLNVIAQLEFQRMGTDEQFDYAAASYGLGADYFLAAGYQDAEGGGGGGSLIRSFTGVYQPDNTGETESFTITNGGQNTFKASSSLAISDTTTCTLVAGVDLEGSEYSLSFNPTGGGNYSIGEVAAPTGGRTLTFVCTRENAVNIENKAGTFALCAGDEYNPDTIVASYEVTR